MESTTSQKKCRTCDLFVDLGKFSRDCSKKDGLRNECKTCHGKKQATRALRLRARKHIAVPASKKCSVCGLEKDSGLFYPDRKLFDGLRVSCKLCEANAQRVRQTERSARKVIEVPGEKFCCGCETVKKGDQFSKNRAVKDGLQSLCLKCSSDIKKRLRQGRRARRGPVPPNKRCPTCKQDRSEGQFHRDIGSSDGLCAICKFCFRVKELKRRHGITLEEYTLMLGEQGGNCGICGSKDHDPYLLGFVVDHDHSTGKTRGLLCTQCNFGIGQFRDCICSMQETILCLVKDSKRTVDVLGRLPMVGDAGHSKRFRRELKSTKEAVQVIMALQGGLCRFCKRDLSTCRNDLDHCHSNGMIRGLLCHGCNAAIGHFKDSPELIQKAIDYLNKYNQPCSPALTVKGDQAS